MQQSKAIKVSPGERRERVSGILARKIRAVASRLMRLWKQRGAWATLQFLLTRIFRHEVHWVYLISTDQVHPPVQWNPTERLKIIDADSLDVELNPALEAFLGGPMALENLSGIRNGDLLFVITDEERYVHRGYALFKTRQKKLLGEEEDTPIIAYCYTPAAARGRHLYQRALVAEIHYLQAIGFRRIAIETDPSNVASQRGILAAGFNFSREVRVWIVLNSLIIRLTRGGAGRTLRVFIL